MKKKLKIRRALFTVSDKEGIVELAQAMVQTGTEIVATGRTAQVLIQSGLSVVPIEKISGSPEAFQGRMKTLSFPVCSGILYRRGSVQDEKDLNALGIQPIDCVVVNFYPFEAAAAKAGVSRPELIEEVDIGGPTLVRAAAKNSPDVLVLTHSSQYSQVIQELNSQAEVSCETAELCARSAWDLVLRYDSAIAQLLGEDSIKNQATPYSKLHVLKLRYGENPHQKGKLHFDPNGPIAWDQTLTSVDLSYNNILDLSAAYGLASELVQLNPHATGVVIVKHNNPCGVALVPKSAPSAQKMALLRAWEGDPVSAFGGVVVFTDPITEESATWLSQHFIELVSAPALSVQSPELTILASKRKKLKAVAIRRWDGIPAESSVSVPGGQLYQTADIGTGEELKSVTRRPWPQEKNILARFGIAVCRALKSNAITLVREVYPSSGVFQLVGAGQGQPNRIDALKILAVPRAQSVLKESEGSLSDCIMISDAFFPFRDTVDAAHSFGIKYIIQPGGSLKDSDSIRACDENGIAMALTGVRHFRH